LWHFFKFLIFRSPSKKIAHTIATAPVTDDKGKLTIPGRPPRSYDNKVQSLGAREPRQAWGEGNPSDELVTYNNKLYNIYLFIYLRKYSTKL